jgi:hypothetical protein
MSDTTVYNNRKKKQLLNEINKLNATAHEEIYKILKSNGISFTQNKNGVFFNMSIVPNDILYQVEQFVIYCLNNKQELDEYDKKINECKLNNTFEFLGKELQYIPTTPSKPSVALTAVINGASASVQDDWQKAIAENRNTEKVTHFASMLEANIEKIHKKKVNTKYINAKKRFARKINVDKKFDIDTTALLKEEAYILFNQHTT